MFNEQGVGRQIRRHDFEQVSRPCARCAVLLNTIQMMRWGLGANPEPKENGTLWEFGKDSMFPEAEGKGVLVHRVRLLTLYEARLIPGTVHT